MESAQIPCPRPRGIFLAQLFLRLLGVVYFCAFLSLLVQLSGLFGKNGISPIHDYLLLLEKLSKGARWDYPSIFWLNDSDAMLQAACIAGCAAALLLVLGILPRLSCIVLWTLYLSFINADYVFLQFQWDNLLVESGFLAIFLAPNRMRMRPNDPLHAAEIEVLFRWLLFRLMFCSGMVKLTSGDPSWQNLTALDYHYLTQPLPNPGAYYIARLPDWFHRISTAALFAIELFVPFLYFCRPKLRRAAAWATIALQLLIILTGNYAFFNILTIALCIFLFDDTPADLRRRPTWILSSLYFLLVVVGTVHIVGTVVGFRELPLELRKTVSVISPLRIINPYGLFAVMTTERREIEIEGSADGKIWKSYGFRYKPDDLKTPPCIVAPHQPRLDWQLWFASLGTPRQNPWFLRLLARLHEGSEPVLALLENNPFPDTPPRYLRALLYRYEFTSMSEKKLDETWWKRKLLGAYLPAVEFREESD